ncbi:MAG: adenosylmethionine--8-amino-7-oxononanoate aminotransferase BioA, partial [Kiritimatiellae bacterium]|nr:adenosylmethionine--8-amino-7-oxononanoate aminotransferase BioA [Kiritimatiellia bacterium]
PRAEDVRRVILETGVWLRPFADFVYSIPPFVVSDAELARICEAIGLICALPPGPPPEDPDFHE